MRRVDQPLDRHLGPELKAFENLQFGHSNTRVTVLPGGQSAYATSEYFIKAKMGDREIDSRGLETLSSSRMQTVAGRSAIRIRRAGRRGGRPRSVRSAGERMVTSIAQRSP